MDIEISEEQMTSLRAYARVPIAFEVRSVLDVVSLAERTLESPYVKELESPTQWARSFDLSNWGLIAARSRGLRVGGAVIAFKTPGVTMLEDRNDLAVLWDIRVAPQVRGKGVGFALFRAVEAWATARGCRQLKVETQNNNVAACRFYQRQGCVLGGVHRSVYPELPSEVQLLWYKDLLALRAQR
jgi:ribosomal protein S18 acetylase RimI-like enzyme